MTATLAMYDAVPEGVPFLPARGIYAGYIDGLFQSYDMMVRARPNQPVLAITVFGRTTPGFRKLILDVENGNPVLAPAVPGWIRSCLANGYRLEQLAVYADESHWPDINASLAADNLPLPPACKWLALYDNDPVIPAGFGAKQYTDKGGPNLGGNNFAYDISSVFPEFIGITVPPPPTEEPVALAIAMSSDGDILVACETQPSGPGKTGEVLALRTTAAWNGRDGIPWQGVSGQTSHLWQSLGVPKP